METLLLRLWVPDGGDGEDDGLGLRGLVDGVDGTSPRPFTSADELVALLRAVLARRTEGRERSVGPNAESARGP